jgi:hypothetical protein
MSHLGRLRALFALFALFALSAIVDVGAAAEPITLKVALYPSVPMRRDLFA